MHQTVHCSETVSLITPTIYNMDLDFQHILFDLLRKTELQFSKTDHFLQILYFISAYVRCHVCDGKARRWQEVCNAF